MLTRSEFENFVFDAFLDALNAHGLRHAEERDDEEDGSKSEEDGSKREEDESKSEEDVDEDEIASAISRAKIEVFDVHCKSFKDDLEAEEESDNDVIFENARNGWKELIGEWLDENKDILQIIEKLEEKRVLLRRRNQMKNN